MFEQPDIVTDVLPEQSARVWNHNGVRQLLLALLRMQLGLDESKQSLRGTFDRVVAWRSDHFVQLSFRLREDCMVVGFGGQSCFSYRRSHDQVGRELAPRR